MHVVVLLTLSTRHSTQDNGAHKILCTQKYSRSNVLTTFLSLRTFQLHQRTLGFHQKDLNLCSEDERRSYRFGKTWGRVIIVDIIFNFGWTIPLSMTLTSYTKCGSFLWIKLLFKEPYNYRYRTFIKPWIFNEIVFFFPFTQRFKAISPHSLNERCLEALCCWYRFMDLKIKSK